MYQQVAGRITPRHVVADDGGPRRHAGRDTRDRGRHEEAPYWESHRRYRIAGTLSKWPRSKFKFKGACVQKTNSLDAQRGSGSATARTIATVLTAFRFSGNRDLTILYILNVIQ